jgi:hypothetical protein
MAVCIGRWNQAAPLTHFSESSLRIEIMGGPPGSAGRFSRSIKPAHRDYDNKTLFILS